MTSSGESDVGRWVITMRPPTMTYGPGDVVAVIVPAAEAETVTDAVKEALARCPGYLTQGIRFEAAA